MATQVHQRKPQECVLCHEIKPRTGRGLCRSCYDRQRNKGTLNQFPPFKYGRGGSPTPVLGKVCSIEGCNKQFLARGWCNMHYFRWKAHGDPTHLVQRKSFETTANEYLLANSDKPAGSECWVWKRRVTKHGYGHINPKWGHHQVHRLAYATWVGSIKKHSQIHHKCSNKACINPDHLQEVTKTDNAAEMLERQAYLKEIRELKKRIRDLEADAA